MTRIRRIARDARAESGVVLVLVAMTLPVLIGVGGIVIDVGNWFAHKRHLQTQADAGALAGAGKFRFPCAQDPILEEVSKYSSIDADPDDPSYNPQIGSTPAEELHQEINSPTWFGQSTPVDDSVVAEPDPCKAKMIDVKLTETELPWFLKIANVPFINTHARVEIRAQTLAKNALPVGVPEVNPKAARAIFVDETKKPTDTGYVIASTPLDKIGNNGSLTTWSNVAAPVPVAIKSTNIGVRIAISATTSTACGDPLVACYETGSSNGLTFIRGYGDTAGAGATSATPPKAGDVRLTTAGCEDAYFTAIATTYPCEVGVSADVSFGTASIDTSRVYARRAKGGGSGSSVALDPPTTPGGPWTGGGISIPAGGGGVPIELRWETGCPLDRTKGCNGSGTANGSFGTVQRAFSAEKDLSGPLKLVRISKSGVSGQNSFQTCPAPYTACTQDLVVTVGMTNNLQNAQSTDPATDPPVVLKVAGGSSLNQALDCDPAQSASNVREEFAGGCNFPYAVNTGQVCPDSENDLVGSPRYCVPTNQGAAVGQVVQGLNERMTGDPQASGADGCAKAPNNWVSDFPDFATDDPRIVQVFITPFGAFDGSGNTTVAVLGFASFYVTGWDKGPCQGRGDDPAGQGEIVGHFIKYIETLNDGGGGEGLCNFDAFGSCVAVFTR